MRHLQIVLAASLVLSGCNHLVKRKPASAPKLQTLEKQHMLVVVHATTEFDDQKTAAPGIDKMISQFKSLGRPVVYLMSDQSAEGRAAWYTEDRRPDLELFSEGGEHNLPVTANEITIVGGFFGSTDTLNGCHALAVRDAMRMHFENSNEPLTIHMPLEAIYFYGEWEGFRDEMLKTGQIHFSETKRYPNRFASIFFLREGNGGRGDDGNEKFFAHKYFGAQNSSYRAGESVDRDRYTFRFWLNETLIEPSVGTGPREVTLRLETSR